MLEHIKNTLSAARGSRCAVRWEATPPDWCANGAGVEVAQAIAVRAPLAPLAVCDLVHGSETRRVLTLSGASAAPPPESSQKFDATVHAPNIRVGRAGVGAASNGCVNHAVSGHIIWRNRSVRLRTEFINSVPHGECAPWAFPQPHRPRRVQRRLPPRRGGRFLSLALEREMRTSHRPRPSRMNLMVALWLAAWIVVGASVLMRAV